RIEKLGEPRINGEPVEKEGSAAAAAAIDHWIIEVGELPHGAAESILGDELEVPRRSLVKIERRLRGLDVDGAVVKDFLELWPKLVHLRMHGLSVACNPAADRPNSRRLGQTQTLQCGGRERRSCRCENDRRRSPSSVVGDRTLSARRVLRDD